MRLYIGGSFQGQAQCALRETGREPRRSDAAASFPPRHRPLSQLLRDLTPEEARAFAQALLEHNPDAVVVCDEVGMGVVPLDAQGRQWREAVGAAMCLLASRARRVTRVVCGIPQRIK